MELQEIIISGLAALLGVINTWYWYDKKRTDADILAAKAEITELRNRQQHFATQAEVKEMIRESIEPIRQDQRDIKTDVREIMSMLAKLSQSIAVLNVRRGVSSEFNDSSDR